MRQRRWLEKMTGAFKRKTEVLWVDVYLTEDRGRKTEDGRRKYLFSIHCFHDIQKTLVPRLCSG